MDLIDYINLLKKYSHKFGIFNQTRSVVHWVEDLFDNNILLQNKSLENIYENERCFIFGNGVSVNDIDMSLLAKEYTLGSNLLHYHKDFHNLNVNCYATISPPRLLKKNHLETTYTDSKINSEEDLQLWLEKDIISTYSIDPIEYYKNVDSDLNNNTLVFLAHQLDRFIGKHRLFKNKQVFYSKPHKRVLEASHQRFDLTKRITFYENVVLFNIAVALYMGFKEIYLIGADYSFEPSREFHFFDELLVSKTIKKEIALQWINNIANARGIEVYKIIEDEEYYKPTFVTFNANRDRDKIVNNFTESMGVKIHIIIPDGFSSPVYHGVSWQYVVEEILNV